MTQGRDARNMVADKEDEVEQEGSRGLVHQWMQTQEKFPEA